MYYLELLIAPDSESFSFTLIFPKAQHWAVFLRLFHLSRINGMIPRHVKGPVSILVVEKSLLGNRRI